MPRRFPWAMLVFIVVAVLVAPALRLRPTHANLLVVLGMLGFIVVVHEAGHVIAALAVRHRIFEVRIGVGPSVKIPIGRARLVIGMFPAGGHVVTATPDARGFRSKRFIVLASGSLMNATLLLVAVAAHATPGTLLYDMAVLNGIVVLANLVPFTGASTFGPQPTDGLSLLRTLILSARELDEQLSAYYLTEAQRLVQRGDRESARAEIGRGLALHPESSVLRTWLGHDLVTSGRYREARTIFSRLVEEEPRRRGLTGRLIHALHLNNLAWADLMTGDRALFSEAERASRAAIEELPRLPAVQGTRAFALIENGRVREGLKLGASALRKGKDPRDRALQACVMAIGSARDWRFPDAQRWLGVARGLDPECGLLDRAAQEIESRLPKPILD